MNPQQATTPVSFNSGGRSGRSLLVTVVLIVLLVGSLAFGFWAFSGRQDFKNNVNQKVSAAVAAANKTQAAQLQAQFDEQSKSPNKTFTGSATYGSISFNYPKTWSAYVDTSNPSEPINAYFNPDTVPGLQSKAAFALRLELLSTDYSQIMQQYSSLITQGSVTSKAYLPPKLQGVANVTAGSYLTGQINSQDPTQSGIMLVIKVRDKTMELSTESNQYANDFNNTVLGSLTFAP